MQIKMDIPSIKVSMPREMAVITTRMVDVEYQVRTHLSFFFFFFQILNYFCCLELCDYLSKYKGGYEITRGIWRTLPSQLGLYFIGFAAMGSKRLLVIVQYLQDTSLGRS